MARPKKATTDERFATAPIPASIEAVDSPETRDWRADKTQQHVAHYDPNTGKFSGPTDAYVWFGEPHQGNPWRDTITNAITQKPERVAPYIDHSRLSTMLGGVAVEWVDWDQETGCNVYRRVA